MIESSDLIGCQSWENKKNDKYIRFYIILIYIVICAASIAACNLIIQ